MRDRAVAGLTLHQYAAVYAATSEGFPLDVVLESEGLSTERWAEIDEVWGDTLSADLQAGGTLSDDFDLAMFEAQETYRRPIPPLDEDLDKWCSFLRAWSEASDPMAFLHARGLGPNDLARLHRTWSRRIADSVELQRKVLAAIDANGEIPVVHPAPLELRTVTSNSPSARALVRPSAITRAPSLRSALPTGGLAEPSALIPPAAPVTEDDDTTAVDEPLVLADGVEEMTQTASAAMDPFGTVPLPASFVAPAVDTVIPSARTPAAELTLAHYAALCAELDVAPEDSAAIFIKYGLTDGERRAQADAFWRERLETRTTTYAEWRQLYRHFREHFIQTRRR